MTITTREGYFQALFFVMCFISISICRVIGLVVVEISLVLCKG